MTNQSKNELFLVSKRNAKDICKFENCVSNNNIFYGPPASGKTYLGVNQLLNVWNKSTVVITRDDEGVYGYEKFSISDLDTVLALDKPKCYVSVNLFKRNDSLACNVWTFIENLFMNFKNSNDELLIVIDEAPSILSGYLIALLNWPIPDNVHVTIVLQNPIVLKELENTSEMDINEEVRGRWISTLFKGDSRKSRYLEAMALHEYKSWQDVFLSGYILAEL